MLKVGVYATNFGEISIFYSAFYQVSDGVNESTIMSIVKDAFAKGKASKCRDEQTGRIIHDGCSSSRYRENVDAYRPIESSNRTEPFEKSRYECFAYHFGRAIVYDLASVGVRVTDDYCYVQAVGMKFLMVSPTINGVSHAINEIDSYFDLNKLKSFFDICFATVGHSSNVDKAVRIMILCEFLLTIYRCVFFGKRTEY